MEEVLRSSSLTILRFIGYASNGFLFGAPVFVLLVLRPALGDPTVAGDGPARRSGRRLEDLVRAALIASIASVLLILLLQVALIAEVRESDLGRALDSVLGSDFGIWSIVRLPVLLGMAILLLGRVSRAGESGATRAWWTAWFVLAITALVTTALAGHASASSPPLSVVNDVVHLMAGATWFAGILGLLVILPDAVDSRPGSVVADAVSRFSTIAFASIAVAAATGTLNSYFDVHHFDDLWDSGFGRTLLVKIGIFVVILGFGAFNHFVIRKRLQKEAAAEAPGGAHRLFRRSILAEVLLALALLACTGLLTGLAPTRH